MKKKAAIVMDVKDGYAVLLKCGEFVKVKDRGYKVGETVALPKANKAVSGNCGVPRARVFGLLFGLCRISPAVGLYLYGHQPQLKA